MEARLKAKATASEQDLANNDTVQFRDDLKQRVLLENLARGEQSNGHCIDR